MWLKHTFHNAFRGVAHFLRSAKNNRIHFPLAVLAFGGGVYFDLPRCEWLAILLAIALVLSAEAFNTALERLCDAVKPGPDHRIRRIKDISAGAVLITAIIALAVALIVFLPRLTGLGG